MPLISSTWAVGPGWYASGSLALFRAGEILSEIATDTVRERALDTKEPADAPKERADAPKEPADTAKERADTPKEPSDAPKESTDKHHYISRSLTICLVTGQRMMFARSPQFTQS